MRNNFTKIDSPRSYKIFLILIGQGLNAVINFLFFPYLARALSVENYGTYGQVLLISDLLKCVFIMGLTNVIYTQLSDKTNNINNVLKSNLLFSFLSGLTGAAIIYLFSQKFNMLFDNPSLNNFLRIICIGFLFQIPYEFLNAVLIYYGKVKHSVIITILTNILKIGLLFYSINVENSMKMAFISSVFVSVMQFILTFSFSPLEFLAKGVIEKVIMKNQLKMSLPLIISSVLGYLLKFIDGLMVSSMLSVKEYAIFRNGAFEIPLISIVYSSVSAILLPELSTLSSENKTTEMITLKKKASSNVALLTIPTAIFVLFFSTPIITLVFGNTYHQSASVFFVINLLLLLRINDYQDILILRSSTKYVFFYNFICLFLNVSFSYFLISAFGVIGAAIATTFSIYIFALLLLNKSTKILNTPMFSFFEGRYLIKISIISILICIILFIPYYLFPVKAIILPLGFSYIIIVYFIFYKIKLIDTSVINALLLKFFNFNRS